MLQHLSRCDMVGDPRQNRVALIHGETSLPSTIWWLWTITVATESFIHSFIHSFINSFIYSFGLICLYLFIYLCIYLNYLCSDSVPNQHEESSFLAVQAPEKALCSTPPYSTRRPFQRADDGHGESCAAFICLFVYLVLRYLSSGENSGNAIHFIHSFIHSFIHFIHLVWFVYIYLFIYVFI